MNARFLPQLIQCTLRGWLPRTLTPLLAAWFLLAAASAQAKVHLKITANTQVMESFKNWTATTPWEQINQFDSAFANRPTVDLVLQFQALKAGGLDFDYEFVSVPNYERGRLEIVEGHADLSAETVWETDTDPAAMICTKPVISNGEFEKGMYVLPDNARAMKVASLEELRALDIVMVANWDVKLVEAIQPKNYNKAAKIENVAMMLQKGRGDYTLLEFSSNPDLSLEVGGVKLVPIPNCKVSLPGNRVWVVAKNAPQAAEVAAALDKGLKALQDEGRLARAFKESGFFNQKVAHWQRLL